MLIKTFAAGVLAASTLAAVPASAAPMNIGATPGVTQVQYGYGPGPSYGERRDYGGDNRHYGQRYDYRHRWLSPGQIRQAVRSQGFRDIRGIDRSGRVYHVRAETYRGRPVALVVSARSGEILSVRRLRG